LRGFFLVGRGFGKTRRFRRRFDIIDFMEIQIFDESLEKFIKSLEKPTIAKVLRTIDLLGLFGPRLGMPHAKRIFDQLFELRIRGRQEVRIFYTFYKNKIVLLRGFIKKSAKIPQKEINNAFAKLRRLTKV
jgi:hypothetical protein